MRRTRRALWLVPPLAAGAFLRLAGLSGQVVTGDEVHGLRAALTYPLPRVFSYQPLDHCIPLSALYRLLTTLGVELTETVIRAPSVVAGLLTVALLPWVAARWGGDRLGAILAWLLALAPSLVYYSRIARPYAVTVLCAALAAAAFWHWYRGGGHRWAVAYAVAGGVALWFHLGVAPFLAAAPAWAAVDRLLLRRLPGDGGDGREPGSGRSLAALSAAAAGLTAAALLVVLPVFDSFRRTLGRKQGDGEAGLEQVLAVLRMEGGSGHDLVVAIFWLAALAGLAVLLRRWPRFALFGLALVLVQWIAVAWVIRPIGLSWDFALGRYVLVTLPVVTLWAAAGLEAGWRGAGRFGGRLGAAVPLGAIAVLALAGPYAGDPWLRLGPFGGTVSAISFHRPAPGLPPDRVPPIYRLMADEPGEGAVVEGVATYFSRHFDSLIALGRIHRRPVVFALPMPWLSDSRLDLRTLIRADGETVCASGARFVVVHRDRAYLEPAVRAWAAGEAQPALRRRRPRAVTVELARELVEECGEPLFQGEDRWVWDLARRER